MSTEHAGGFSVGDLVTFHSIHGEFEINGEVCKIMEIKEDRPDRILFPEGLVFRLEFQHKRQNLAMTWCRVDEMKKLKYFNSI